MESIQNTIEVLKLNIKNTQAFEQIASTIPENLAQLEEQIKEMRKTMAEIKQKWFTALDKQHYAKTLNDKITRKLEKVNGVQSELNILIDDITQEIELNDVDEVCGESACMLIQQHIVATNLLLDKVDKIKDQMDRGELDGRSNLGSMLNSVADPEVNMGLENNSQVLGMNGAIGSKIRQVTKIESNINDQN